MKRRQFIFASLGSIATIKGHASYNKNANLCKHSSQKTNQNIYPVGSIFPFGFYAGQSIKSHNESVTLLGPYSQEKNIDYAKRNGIKCVYSLGVQRGEIKDLTQIKLADIYQLIYQEVKKVVHNSEIAWWYLLPEELRHWNVNEMKYLRTAISAIKKADHLNRPIWMYEPNHRTWKALAKTVKYLDICGKGMYTNYAKQQHNRVWVRWSIEQELKAISYSNPSAIPIAVAEMFSDPEFWQQEVIERWVRHDVYLSLVSGAKGVMVFSGWRRPSFKSFDAYLQAYSKISNELNGPLQLGNVFLFGEKKNDIELRVFGSSPTLTLRYRGEIYQYPSVAMINIDFGELKYLFLVNSSNDPKTISLRTSNNLAINKLFIIFPTQNVQELKVDPREIT